MKYSEQLYMDFPTKDSIDKLSLDKMKDMWINAPVGYFSVSSTLATYFEERLEKAGVFTTEFQNNVDKIYISKVFDRIVFGEQIK